MPRELVFAGQRCVEMREYEEPALGPRDVRIRNLLSGISHGTELAHYRGEAIWLHKRVESDGFVTEGRSLDYPFGYGYEDVGVVTAIGAAVTEVAVGDRVLCWIGHRETGTVNLDRINVSTSSIFLRLPDDSDCEKYVFVALGTTAFDGVLVSGLRLGESAVVIGQGVVGLLTTQLCKLAGADPVIAVDLLDQRLAIATRLGADHVLNPRHGDVGRQVRELLGGHGADVCFEASGKTAGLNLALHCGAPFPKVVAIGMYDGPATDLYLNEEFCRSGGQILHSRSGGYRLRPEPPTEGQGYHRKWDVVRINQTIIRYLHSGKLETSDLITNRFSLHEASHAYDLIDRHPEDVIKVIFDLQASG